MRSAVSILALICAAGLATAAHAQTPLQAPPPAEITRDERGVDLLSGRLVQQATLVSSGDAASGLAYSRTYFNTQWRDNITATLTQSSGVWTVSIGGQSDTFTLSGSTYTPRVNRGQSLVSEGSTHFVYQTADGLRVRFQRPRAFFSGASALLPFRYMTVDASEGLVEQIALPNGERLSFTYQPHTMHTDFDPSLRYNIIRLSGVSNRNGFSLSPAYAFAGTMPQNDADAEDFVKLVGMVADQSGQGVLLSGGSWTDVTVSGEPRTTEIVPVTGGMAVRWPMDAPTDTNSIAVAYGTGADANRVVSYTTGGDTWGYSYSTALGPSPNQTTVVTYPGSTISNPINTAATFNAAGQLIRYRDTAGRLFKYVYGSTGGEAGRVKTVIGPWLTLLEPPDDAASTDFEYDTRGNVTKVTVHAQGRADPGPSESPAPIITQACYAASCNSTNFRICNLPETTTDARNQVTTYSYAAEHGGVTAVTLPVPSAAPGSVQPQTRISYQNFGTTLDPWYLPIESSQCATGSAGGAPSCVGTADETRTVITYTAAHRQVETVTQRSGNTSGTGALSAATMLTYNAAGDVTQVNGPLPPSPVDDITHIIYDPWRRPVGVIGPDPDGAGAMLNRASRTYYNANGQVTRSDVGTFTGAIPTTPAAFYTGFNILEQSSNTYDTAGRVIRTRFTAAGTYYATQDFQYYQGRLLCATERMNPALLATGTAACTANTEGAFGPDRITHYGVDSARRVNAVTTGYGTTDAITTSITFEAVSGRPSTVTDGRGNVTTYAYDGFGRLSRRTYTNPSTDAPSTNDFDEYAYDAASNVTSFRNRAASGATFAYTYDNLNRLQLIDAPSGGSGNFDTSFTYDNFNRPLTATLASSPVHVVTNTWDALSRLTGQSSGRNVANAATYRYDEAGRRTRIAWSNGTYATYYYNVYGETTGINQSLSAVLATYSYDNLGRRTSIERANGATTSYTWSPASRLTALTHDLTGGTTNDLTISLPAADYSPAGQIGERVLSNSAYAFTGRSTGTINYTNNRLNQVINDGVGITYDTRGNLTGDSTRTFTYNASNQLMSGTTPTVTLSYDPLGRLYGLNDGTENVRFQYDGLMPIAEYTSDDATLQRRHVPGPGLNEVLLTYEGATGNTVRNWYMQDERLSVVARTDNAGALLSGGINTYDEYGIPASGMTSGSANRFQYTGQVRLPGDLYHYRARAYEPTLGRFLQPDPIGYAAGLNLYSYVGGDPVNLVDPLGLQDTPTDPGPIIVTGERPCTVRNPCVETIGVDSIVPGDSPFPWRPPGIPRVPRTPVEVVENLREACQVFIDSGGDSNQTIGASFAGGAGAALTRFFENRVEQISRTLINNAARYFGLRSDRFRARVRAAAVGSRISSLAGYGAAIAGWCNCCSLSRRDKCCDGRN